MPGHASVGLSYVLRFGMATCATVLAMSHLSPAAAAEPQVVPLWPNGAPLATGTAAADQPFLEVYPAADDAAGGPAFMICPGGGYGGLAADHEGAQIARWANGIGATAFVLHYRLGSKGYHYPVQLIDVQRALRSVRANAARYKVDPRRIGIIGFSAGGHLASMAATLFDERPEGTTHDEVDSVSARPDVAVLGYPVISMTAAHAHRGSRKNLLGSAADDDQAARRLGTDTPGVPGTNGVVTTMKPRPGGEPWRLDFSGSSVPEPLTIDIVR